MSQTAPVRAAAAQNWTELIEQAGAQSSSDAWLRRIEEVQDAIMEEMEDCFQTASPMERQSLINAMNTVRELKRLAEIPGRGQGLPSYPPREDQAA